MGFPRAMPQPFPMMRRLIRWMVTAPRLLVLLAPAAAAAFFLAGSAAGFDFTDEGFYYLSFAHPENVSDNQTSFHFFGSLLFPLVGRSIVAMRILTLASTLTGTLLFLRGARRFTAVFAPPLTSDAEHRQLALGATLMVSFLGFAISPPALSYNFQNLFCLLTAAGFLLDACARPPSTRLLDPAVIAPLAVFGLLTGLEFFIKFSSSVPLGLTGLALYLWVGRPTRAQKLASAGALLLCALVVALAYFALLQEPAQWWHGVKGTFFAIWQDGYAGSEIRRYGAEIGETSVALLRDWSLVWLVAAGAIGAVVALRFSPRWQVRLAMAGGGALLAGVAWLCFDRYIFADNAQATPVYLATLLLFALLAAGSRLTRPHVAATCPPLAAAGFLFLLPYLGAFGTNNPIHLNCLFQIAPWCVLAAWLLAAIDQIWGSAWPSRLGLLLLAGVAFGQFYEGYWIRPYRSGGPRPDLETPTAVGRPASTLRLASEASEFVVTARHVLEAHGFQPGDDLLVFFNLPGFVFAMGGASPGHPWYFQGSRRNYELDLMRLNFIPAERRRRAFIVRNSVETDWADFQPYLRQAGLNFPEDYTLVSPPMTSPLTRVPFEIWVPKIRLASTALPSPGK